MPYSTLISGGQATKSVLFYNNARGKIGLVGFWDTVAFDEVGGLKVKDPDTIQIMKDFMANGRFSRGVEVIADASMAFVGNIDQSIEQIVNSTEYDLFLPLPPQFDLAVMDRFACYLPRGWRRVFRDLEFEAKLAGIPRPPKEAVGAGVARAILSGPLAPTTNAGKVACVPGPSGTPRPGRR